VAGTAVAWFSATQAGPPWVEGHLLKAVILLCLTVIVALGFQIGCNFANDYSDGVRGTDDNRVGPMRLVGSGAAQPPEVKRAAWICFAIACGAGIFVVALAIGFFEPTWQFSSLTSGGWGVPAGLVLIGLACVLAAWFYTGGRRPYGYAGLGELFVFIFFGLVATVGTVFVQAPLVAQKVEIAVGCVPTFRDIHWPAALCMGIIMGCFSTAILVANNLRDLPKDAEAGKNTLAVRIGDRSTRFLYTGLILIGGVGIVIEAFLTSWFVLLGLIGIGLSIPLVVKVMGQAKGLELVSVLKSTGIAQFVTALLAGIGLALGWLYG
jgi:1,4-dihydroxy-2-naphthoate octaprenyltransferase